MTHDEVGALPAQSIIAVCISDDVSTITTATDFDQLERVAFQKNKHGYWFGIGIEEAVNSYNFPVSAFPVLLLWTPDDVLTIEELDAHHD